MAKRDRAMELAEHVLRSSDAGQAHWPLTLATKVCVLGSFARGALDPYDLDMDVECCNAACAGEHVIHYGRAALNRGCDYVPVAERGKPRASGFGTQCFYKSVWEPQPEPSGGGGLPRCHLARHEV